ncbi:hypothetical protein CKO15_04120 [Halorhodospira abdelmalekii]|uniref:restriction endonuclease subunit S n=1 Tax=Halorhodospira abdelmalekii TaxID=421629 RepID=UPI0019040211|nr:restriction endonuclease subunit S [Halorhodospira abdelmalekii]MBK1734484.1 hypothetical protein [Halorhodospira abdelmalekii]
MRADWVFKPLGEVCNVVGGGTPSKRNPAFYEGDIPWATIRDMRDEVLDCTEFKISSEAVKNSATNVIPSGNVVIATRVGLGKVCVLDQDTAINQDLRGIIPKEKNLDVRFLFRWFQSVSHVIEAEGTGATVKGVKLPFVKALKTPVPPLPEQKRIVAILDEAFAGIATAVANTEKNLANARELFESYLNAVFSQEGDQWNFVPLDKHIKFIDYRGKTPKKTQHGLRLITAKNVRMGFLRREPEEFINKDDYEAWMTRGIPIKGDVLFTTEAPLGLVCQLDTDEQVAFAQRIISMQPNREVIDPGYLCYALRSPLVQSRIHKKATGATATGIKASLLKKIHIPLVSIEKQRNIVARLESLESATLELEFNFKQKLDSLAELKQSLLQKAFSGELTAGKEAADTIRQVEEVT